MGIYVIITYSIQQRALYCTELTEYTCTQSCTVMYFRILYGRRKKLSPNDFTENIRQLLNKQTIVCLFVLLNISKIGNIHCQYLNLYNFISR